MFAFQDSGNGIPFDNLIIYKLIYGIIINLLVVNLYPFEIIVQNELVQEDPDP